MARRLTTAALALAPLGAAACGVFDSGPAEVAGCLPSYSTVEQTARQQLDSVNLADAAVLVRVDGRTVCRFFLGSYGPGTRVPTASAAKWLTAATVLTVVDRGAIRLDTHAMDFFPTAPAADSGIILAQLLSHTSGLLWFSRCMGSAAYTLQACAQTILEGDLQFEPGTGFFYAGPPFTVAGAMAERATGRSWEDLFQTSIAEPLGLSGTTYGTSPNPALSEGAVVSTLDDYGRFAQMILDDGVWGGRRVLSHAAISQMRRNWSAGLPVVNSPRGEVAYGLGAWLDSVDASGTGIVLSSPGIGGFVPLLDYRRRMVFVFAAEADVTRIWPAVTAILQAARGAADRPAYKLQPAR